MCPACLTTLALIAAGTGSAGGLAAAVVSKIRKKPSATQPVPEAPASAPATNDATR